MIAVRVKVANLTRASLVTRKEQIHDGDQGCELWWKDDGLHVLDKHGQEHLHPAANIAELVFEKPEPFMPVDDEPMFDGELKARVQEAKDDDADLVAMAVRDPEPRPRKSYQRKR